MSNKMCSLYRILLLFYLLAACSGKTNQDSVLVLEAFLCIDTDCSIGVFTSPITRDQAKKLLEEKYGTDNVSANGGRWHTSSGTGYLEFNKDSVLVASRFQLEEEMFTMENLVNQFREPSQVYVVRAFSPDYPCAGSIVFYPEPGIEAFLYPPVNRTIGIVPHQFISSLEVKYIGGSEYHPPTDIWVFEWQGFEDYCELVANPTSSPSS